MIEWIDRGNSTNNLLFQKNNIFLKLWKLKKFRNSPIIFDITLIFYWNLIIIKRKIKNVDGNICEINIFLANDQKIHFRHEKKVWSFEFFIVLTVHFLAILYFFDKCIQRSISESKKYTIVPKNISLSFFEWHLFVRLLV